MCSCAICDSVPAYLNSRDTALWYMGARSLVHISILWSGSAAGDERRLVGIVLASCTTSDIHALLRPEQVCFVSTLPKRSPSTPWNYCSNSHHHCAKWLPLHSSSACGPNMQPVDKPEAYHHHCCCCCCGQCTHISGGTGSTAYTHCLCNPVSCGAAPS